MKPFFIVGAPRSGTTMLRDLFKQIPTIYAPEETHFFRWAAPFRGNEFNAVYKNNAVLKKHRELDGVSDADFYKIYNSSYSKADMTKNYCERVAGLKEATHWFEKSPQNIYGLPLIASQIPTAMVINLIRHPYDVVKSLLVGKVIKVDDVVGAANYWNEAIDIAKVVKPYLGDRMLNIKYEDLMKNPSLKMSVLLDFLDAENYDIDFSHIKPRVTDYTELLSFEDRKSIDTICGENMSRYGYALTT